MLVRKLFFAAIFFFGDRQVLLSQGCHISGLLSPGLFDDETLVRELTCSDFQKRLIGFLQENMNRIVVRLHWSLGIFTSL